MPTYKPLLFIEFFFISSLSFPDKNQHRPFSIAGFSENKKSPPIENSLNQRARLFLKIYSCLNKDGFKTMCVFRLEFLGINGAVPVGI